MALTGVWQSIAPLEQALAVRTFSGGWVGSEYMRGEPQDTTLSLAPLPLSPRDLKNLDSGEFSLEDKKFYQQASGQALAVNDQIQHAGFWYTIRKPPFDRSDDGGYRVYFAKRNIQVRHD